MIIKNEHPAQTALRIKTLQSLGFSLLEIAKVFGVSVTEFLEIKAKARLAA